MLLETLRLHLVQMSRAEFLKEIDIIFAHITLYHTQRCRKVESFSFVFIPRYWTMTSSHRSDRRSL